MVPEHVTRETTSSKDCKAVEHDLLIHISIVTKLVQRSNN